MSYKRIAIPRVYTDWVNWMDACGQESVANSVSIGLGGNTMASGSSVEGMFDLNPSALQTISCNGTGNDIYIQVDTNLSTDSIMDYNYLAILGHNFEDAGAKFQIQTDDSSTFASVQYADITNKVNSTFAGTGSSGWSTPPKNGWSLGEWTRTTDNRYVRIKISPVSSTYTADIKIGSVMFGEYFSFPHRPNLSHKIDLKWNNKIKESLGGTRYSVATNKGKNLWFLDKWAGSTSSTPYNNRRNGRAIFNLSWSFIKDTDMWVKNSTLTQYIENDSIENKLLHKVQGSHLPFIFQLDDTLFQSGDEEWSNFYLVRMTKHSMQQTAPNLWTFKCTLEEEL